MLLVEFEQLDNIGKVLNLILQTLIDNDVEIKLLVAPVNLKNRLETAQKVGSLFVRIINDLIDTLLLTLEKFLVTDPGEWV
jgi:hypothetical protein